MRFHLIRGLNFGKFVALALYELRHGFTIFWGKCTPYLLALFNKVSYYSQSAAVAVGLNRSKLWHLCADHIARTLVF